MNNDNNTGWLARLTTRTKTLETLIPRAVLNVGTASTVAITAAQALKGVFVSNRGAAGEVIFSLPAATPGMQVTANVMETQLLSLDPVDTEIIYTPAAVALTEDAAIKANAKGEFITLTCITAGTWVTTAYAGTWSANAS